MALGRAWWRGVDTPMPLVLIAAVTVFVAGGLADVSALGHSQVATTLPVGAARLLVALALGLGAGLGTGAALRLRRGEPPHPADRPVATEVATSVR